MPKKVSIKIPECGHGHIVTHVDGSQWGKVLVTPGVVASRAEFKRRVLCVLGQTFRDFSAGFLIRGGPPKEFLIRVCEQDLFVIGLI